MFLIQLYCVLYGVLFAGLMIDILILIPESKECVWANRPPSRGKSLGAKQVITYCYFLVSARDTDLEQTSHLNNEHLSGLSGVSGSLEQRVKRSGQPVSCSLVFTTTLSKIWSCYVALVDWIVNFILWGSKIPILQTTKQMDISGDAPKRRLECYVNKFTSDKMQKTSKI